MDITQTEKKIDYISLKSYIFLLLVVVTLASSFAVGANLLGIIKTSIVFCALIGGSIVFLLILRQPFIGILLIGFFIPFEMYQRILPSHLTISKVLALMTLISYILEKLLYKKEFISPLGFLPLILFAFFNCLSVFVARNKIISVGSAIQIINFVILYVLISDIIKTEKHIRIIINTFLMTGLLISIFGIAQYIAKSPIGLGSVSRDAEEAFKIQKQIGLETGETVFRIVGTFEDPNEYAAYLIIILFIALNLLNFSKNKLSIIFYIILSTFYIINLILTFSRSGYLAGIMTFFIFILFSKRRVIILSLISLLIFLSIILLPDVYLERFKNIFEYKSEFSSESRLQSWESGFKMGADNIILGVGPGNYSLRIREYSSFIFAYDAHNNFIRCFAETGILSIVSLLIFLIIYYTKILGVLIKSKRGTYLFAILKGLTIGSLGYFIMGMFLSNLYKPNIWYILGLGAITFLIQGSKTSALNTAKE